MLFNGASLNVCDILAMIQRHWQLQPLAHCYCFITQQLLGLVEFINAPTPMPTTYNWYAQHSVKSQVPLYCWPQRHSDPASSPEHSAANGSAACPVQLLPALKAEGA